MIMRLWETWGAVLGQRVAGSYRSLSGRGGLEKWQRESGWERKLEGGTRGGAYQTQR